jgi:integrase/recombinase XerD
VRLRLSAIASDRLRIRVKQGKGRKDRSTLLSARLLAELRTSWPLYRPAPWRLTGPDRTQPLSIATAQTLSYRAKRAAGIRHGKGLPTLRHGLATYLLAAGVALPTIQLLLGPRTSATTTRALPIPRRHLAQGHSPFDLRSVAAELPGVATA